MTITTKVVKLKKDFDMNSSSSCKFHHSQWEQCSDKEHASIPYLVYRILFMAILVSSMTFSTLCQSYLFQIFLTNWSFTLQTLYAVLFCFNVLWKMRGYLMQTFTIKLHQVHPESNAKTYEMKEASVSWDNVAASDKNGMLVNEDKKNSSTCVDVADINDTSDDQPQQSILAADSSALRKSETSVIIVNNNNNKNDGRCNNSDQPSVLEKTIWILMNVSHVLPHIVAFGYWIFVYKYDPNQKACERFRSHYIVHGATSVLALIDSLIVAIPVRKSHFVFPSFVLLIYSLFSYVYEAAGGPYRNGKEYIYSILNWRHKPGKTLILVIVGFILSPLMHLIACWGAHHVKLWLVSWYLKRRSKQ